MIIKSALLALAALVSGLMLGDAIKDEGRPVEDKNAEIIQTLMLRNAELESQVSSVQSVTTALTVALVLLACALAVCLVLVRRSRKEGHVRREPCGT